jgi:hypothetical protein
LKNLFATVRARPTRRNNRAEIVAAGGTELFAGREERRGERDEKVDSRNESVA